MSKPTETGELCGERICVTPGGELTCEERKGHDPDFHSCEYVWAGGA